MRSSSPVAMMRLLFSKCHQNYVSPWKLVFEKDISWLKKYAGSNEPKQNEHGIFNVSCRTSSICSPNLLLRNFSPSNDGRIGHWILYRDPYSTARGVHDPWRSSIFVRANGEAGIVFQLHEHTFHTKRLDGTFVDDGGRRPVYQQSRLRIGTPIWSMFQRMTCDSHMPTSMSLWKSMLPMGQSSIKGNARLHWTGDHPSERFSKHRINSTSLHRTFCLEVGWYSPILSWGVGIGTYIFLSWSLRRLWGNSFFCFSDF